MNQALLSSRDLGFTVGSIFTQLQHLQLPPEQAVSFLKKQLPMFQVLCLNPSSSQKIANDAYASLSMRYFYRRPVHGIMKAHTVDVTIYLRPHPTSITCSIGA